MHRGSCLCGAVTIRIVGDLPAPNACHCDMCRRWSGHHWASTEVKRDALQVQGPVTWHQSSEKIRRGFCAKCGSVLFWDPVTGTDWTAVAMGALEKPTDTKLALHIFTADKGDYYDIADGLPQNEQ